MADFCGVCGADAKGLHNYGSDDAALCFTCWEKRDRAARFSRAQKEYKEILNEENGVYRVLYQGSWRFWSRVWAALFSLATIWAIYLSLQSPMHTIWGVPVFLCAVGLIRAALRAQNTDTTIFIAPKERRIVVTKKKGNSLKESVHSLEELRLYGGYKYGDPPCKNIVSASLPHETFFSQICTDEKDTLVRLSALASLLAPAMVECPVDKPDSFDMNRLWWYSWKERRFVDHYASE